MDWNNPIQRAAFLDLHSDNPREGPGDFVSAKRAFKASSAALDRRSSDARSSPTGVTKILDLACGPGMQTRHLAQLAPDAEITAIDLRPSFIKRLNRWIAESGESGRISAIEGDMSEPAVEQGATDLIWCEGAVYMLGVEQALTLWQPLLSAGGCVAFTEPVFLSQQLPAEVVANWEEYPAMTDVAGVARQIEAAGYSLVESFVLASDAWAEYYDPLQLRVNLLREKYIDDAEAALVIEEGQSEIDAWRNYGEHFSYAFFVAQLPATKGLEKH